MEIHLALFFFRVHNFFLDVFRQSKLLFLFFYVLLFGGSGASSSSSSSSSFLFVVVVSCPVCQLL